MGHIIAIFGWSFRNVKWGHEPGTEKEGTVTCEEGPKKSRVIITRIQTERKIQEYKENELENATASGAKAHQKNQEGKGMLW